jgi:hypothetical protein
MLINNFSRHIFWSYKENADLPDEVIIRNVSLYGEYHDLARLTELYTKEIIMDVLNSILPKNKKRINFIVKVFL